jgi:hypothetical protein
VRARRHRSGQWAVAGADSLRPSPHDLKRRPARLWTSRRAHITLRLPLSVAAVSSTSVRSGVDRHIVSQLARVITGTPANRAAANPRPQATAATVQACAHPCVGHLTGVRATRATVHISSPRVMATIRSNAPVRAARTRDARRTSSTVRAPASLRAVPILPASASCRIASAVNDLVSEPMGKGVCRVIACARPSWPNPRPCATSPCRTMAMAMPGTLDASR